MNRFTSFVAGIVVGVVGLYGSMNFFIVRSNDGVQFVRKLSPEVAFPYVDIRSFTVTDWQKHTQLAAALAKSGKSGVLGKSASNAMGESVSNAVDNWMNDQNWNR